MQDKIVIRGAREHNLKNINLELPRNKMIVFTGLSGSGKSSLAFDTIFAEGQRRYVESLSAYARQFLGGLQKPDVDEIEGLSPAISIDQKAHSANPRSTVATITEVYDYLRVLYARVGRPHCPLCGTKIEKMTVDEMRGRIVESLPRAESRGLKSIKSVRSKSGKSDSVISTGMINGQPTPTPPKRGVVVGELMILSPVVRGRKGEYYQMLYDIYNSGYLEVRVDGKMHSLKERIVLSKNNKHNIEVVVDRFSFFPRGSEEGVAEVPAPTPPAPSRVPMRGSGSRACLGTERDISRRLSEAITNAVDLSNGLCSVIYPDGAEQILSTEYSCPKDGFSFPEIEPRLFSFNSPYGYCGACSGLGTKELFSEEICPKCLGKRLNDNALAVKIAGKNIWEVTSLAVAEARDFFASVDLEMTEKEKEISGAVLKEISNRLDFMHNVGLHYLTLNRRAGTLSGGEAQRIRLASQVGTRLVGALYVLDEPTIGLHQKDNDRLIKTLCALRDAGNTIIVVEHDEDTIRASDWVVDFGPGAGTHGGEIVYSGPANVILNDGSPLGRGRGGLANCHSRENGNPDNHRILDPRFRGDDNGTGCKMIGDPAKSLTGKYLRGELKILLPEKLRRVDSSTPKLKIKGANVHNLKNLNVEIPLHHFVCLTGVSGSGKSTLMHDVLREAVINKLYRLNRELKCKNITGTEYLENVVTIDQSPIGRTSRSNPATYTKAFDHIRELFAATPESRIRGFSASHFSFNVPSIGGGQGGLGSPKRSGGGRCEHCEGKGVLEIEMHFLPSVEVVCDVCKGKRFTEEILEVHYKEKSIADVLGMTIEEAEEFFKDVPQIYDKLKILNEVGLDYLTLGQSATTLSGGEAQRIKLSRELAKRGLGKTLYLLDEPTTGLHFDDVKKLIVVLQRLVSQGNSILVIEHNLDVIKNADWVIDLGPEGGDKGGELVAEGTPLELSKKAGSFTGQYLRRAFR